MPTQPNDSPRATHSSQPSVQSATITPSGPLLMDRVHQGDCLELLARVPAGTVHLAFADPPFNIGYDYDAYDDRRSSNDYLGWSKQWMSEMQRVLRPDGTFWRRVCCRAKSDGHA